MYFAIVIACMAVGPIATLLIEPLVTHAPFDFWTLLGRWFVFWAIGVRLFTAETIFGTTDAGALRIVPELGFANISAGVVALASLALPGFIVPIALYGALFYGFATAGHLRGLGHLNRTETVALVSDGWITAILAAVLLARLLGW